MLSPFDVAAAIRLWMCASVLLPCFQAAAAAQIPVVTETNVVVLVAAANLTSGNFQRYETPGLNILKGLKPDVVAIQEFNYASSTGTNTAAAIREMVDITFGTHFSYFRESGYSIPNGIISRYPIVASGSWIDSDTGVNDRGFAWARIDVPGTNDLYVVSVHLKSGSDSAARRNAQASELRNLIQTNFPANAWIIVAGDLNTDTRTEAAMTTLKTFLSDDRIPSDHLGDPDTNAGRTKPYDYVLPSFSLTNRLTSVALPSRTFSNGLVFDSRVYTPLSDVPPVQSSDSGASGMQHMAVVKAFQIPYAVTNWMTVPPPILTMQTPARLEWRGLSNVTYTVQQTTNLNDPNWTTAGTASSSTTNVVFTNQADDAPQKFFRVLYP
jgi:endonuclease/exonuclease/phosphatase family metal-dependent hydrolase